MAELYDPSEGFRSGLNTLAQSFIAGMQAKQQKEAADREFQFRQEQAQLAQEREDRLQKAQEAQNAMLAYRTGREAVEAGQPPESVERLTRAFAPQLYPDVISQKPVSEILPPQQLPTVRPPMQAPATDEQRNALQQLQVLGERLNSIDNLPAPENIKNNLREYLTGQLRQYQDVAFGVPSSMPTGEVRSRWPGEFTVEQAPPGVIPLETRPRGESFIGAKPLPLRPAGRVEQRAPAPSLFQAPGVTSKVNLPLVKEAFQTVTKLFQEGNIPAEEGQKFMASWPQFLKSGNIEDLYLPQQLGENVSKQQRMLLENLRLQQQIKTSQTSEELMRLRMAQMQGETPGAKLEDIMAKARAATLGREQARAEVSLQQTGNIAGNLTDVLGFYNKIPKEIRGPGFGGTVRAPVETLLKSDPNLVAFEDSKRFFLANLSRQFGGERGVLTDADVKRVESLLPSARDTDESAKAKTGMIYNLVDREVKRAQAVARLPITGLGGLSDQTYNQLMDATRKGKPVGAPGAKETEKAPLPPPAITPGTQPKPSDPATTKYLQENFPHLYPSSSVAPLAPSVPTTTQPAPTQPVIPEEMGIEVEDMSKMSDDELLQIMLSTEQE